jgi:uncharacterized protein
MKPLHFDWDENKNAINKKRHKGVSFEEAQTAFSDPDHSDDEDRFILLGMSERFRVLVTCQCYRDNDSVIRIISARKATKPEMRTYEEYLK